MSTSTARSRRKRAGSSRRIWRSAPDVARPWRSCALSSRVPLVCPGASSQAGICGRPSTRASCDVQRGTCNAASGAEPWPPRRRSSSASPSTVFYRLLQPSTVQAGRVGKPYRLSTMRRGHSCATPSRPNAPASNPPPARRYRAISAGSTRRSGSHATHWLVIRGTWSCADWWRRRRAKRSSCCAGQPAWRRPAEHERGGVTRYAVWLRLVLGLAFAAPGGGAFGQAPAARTGFAERWPFAGDGSVRIVNPSGRIRVIGWDVDSLAVSGHGPGRLAAAGTASVRKLLVTGGGAELEVRVPRGARVWAKSASADIDVVGVDGALDLNSVAGAIHVVGTPADGTAETMGGPVELAGGSGRARVKTVSGDILLRGASVDLGASTLSGTIVVRAAGWQRGGTGVQRGHFESVTGDVRFDGELGRGGIVELESQSGTPLRGRGPRHARARLRSGPHRRVGHEPPDGRPPGRAGC